MDQKQEVKEQRQSKVTDLGIDIYRTGKNKKRIAILLLLFFCCVRVVWWNQWLC